eukprot:345267-Chlamydomonas_euryale.AAC.1
MRVLAGLCRCIVALLPFMLALKPAQAPLCRKRATRHLPQCTKHSSVRASCTAGKVDADRQGAPCNRCMQPASAELTHRQR